MSRAPQTRPEPDAEAILERLGTPETNADPYSLYKTLRSMGPIQTSVSGAPVLFLSRFEDCAAVIRDPQFGAQTPEWCERSTPGWREHPASWAFESLLFRDPPDHTRLRHSLNSVFGPRRAERARNRDLRVQLTGMALDRLADGGAAGGVVDLQEIFTSTLPVALVGSMIGIPETDWPALSTA